MASKTRQFSDIDLSFIPHPVTKDLVGKYDDAAIKNSVKNLVLTKHFERPFHSEIGSSVTAYLFDIPSPATVAMLKQEITDTINNFEPRVVILDIKVIFSPDNNRVMVTIVFRIVNTARPITLQFTLDRTR